MSLARLFLTCCSIFIFSAVLQARTAHAERDVRRLTENNVREFIEETTELTSGHNLDMSEDQMRDYLDKHLDKKSRFKTTISFNIPGFPPQEKSLSLDKNDFIDYVQQGAGALEHYENRISVDSVRISKDGERASVSTSSFESGMMPMPVEGGSSEDVPVEGQSKCQQIIKLTKGVIQMYSAVCKTDIEFLPY